MKSRNDELERIRKALAHQSADWKQIVQGLEELDPGTMVAVPSELLEAIDEACTNPVSPFRSAAAPFGAIRA